MSLIIDVLTGGVRGGTSILYAALGETVSRARRRDQPRHRGSDARRRARGVHRRRGDRQPLARRARPAALVGAALSLVHALLVVWRGANQFASGLTVLFLALGLTSLFGASYVGRTITPFDVWAIPVLSDIPVHRPGALRPGPARLPQLPRGARSCGSCSSARSAGLLLRTAGERSDALTVHGADVRVVRTWPRSPRAASSPASAARTSRSRTPTRGSRTWSPDADSSPSRSSSSPRWGPVKVMGGAYLFGAALALGPALQARGIPVNQFLLHVIPFVLTLVVLAALGRRSSNRGARRAQTGVRERRRPPPSASGGRDTPTDHPHPSLRSLADPLARPNANAARSRPAPPFTTPAPHPTPIERGQAAPAARPVAPVERNPRMARSTIRTGVAASRSPSSSASPAVPRPSRPRPPPRPTAPPAPAAPRSASSWSARRTTTATTRPCTRHPRSSATSTPTSRSSRPRTSPRTTAP